MAIELRKKGDKVSLVKKGESSLGEIRVNLKWESGANQPIDLDLACLYELSDGTKGVVQALGGTFGSFHAPPFIELDGDDRTGASEQGETLRINGEQIAVISRILVFAFIYEGVASWKDAKGVVTLQNAHNEDVLVRLDEHDPKLRTCAIALVKNMHNEQFAVEKVLQFFSGHPDMDLAFGWGLKWMPAKK